MKEIVERLTENRQIELAKSILESNGYKVSKRLNEGRMNGPDPHSISTVEKESEPSKFRLSVPGLSVEGLAEYAFSVAPYQSWSSKGGKHDTSYQVQYHYAFEESDYSISDFKEDMERLGASKSGFEHYNFTYENHELEAWYHIGGVTILFKNESRADYKYDRKSRTYHK